MQFSTLTPMLYTMELKATLQFYTNTLGFTVDTFNEEWGWLHMHSDEAKIMFSLPNSHITFDKPAFTGTFYFTVTDVDALWDKLKDTTHIYYGIENFEYGMREFAIKDNNGYILQFGQEIPANNASH